MVVFFLEFESVECGNFGKKCRKNFLLENVVLMFDVLMSIFVELSILVFCVNNFDFYENFKKKKKKKQKKKKEEKFVEVFGLVDDVDRMVEFEDFDKVVVFGVEFEGILLSLRFYDVYFKEFFNI